MDQYGVFPRAGYGFGNPAQLSGHAPAPGPGVKRPISGQLELLPVRHVVVTYVVPGPRPTWLSFRCLSCGADPAAEGRGRYSHPLLADRAGLTHADRWSL